MKKTTLQIEVEYDPQVTDPEALASAADSLLETATGLIPLDEYGSPKFGEFKVNRPES